MSFPLQGFCPAHVHGRGETDTARITDHLKLRGLLDTYQAPRKVGSWVDPPPPLEGTDEQAKKVKGFKGTFARVSAAQEFLKDASPAVREASVLRMVELNGLFAKQADEVLKDAERVPKITTVATFEYESLNKKSCFELHSDGGGLMYTTTHSNDMAKYAKTWLYYFPSVELSPTLGSNVVLKGHVISELGHGTEATFELSWLHGQLRGNVGSPDLSEQFDAMFFMGKGEVAPKDAEPVPVVVDEPPSAGGASKGGAETGKADEPSHAKPAESAETAESAEKVKAPKGKKKKAKTPKGKKGAGAIGQGLSTLRNKMSSLLQGHEEPVEPTEDADGAHISVYDAEGNKVGVEERF